MSDKEAKKAKRLANLKPFEKGDPRINRKGAPKKLPALKKLLELLMGGEEDEDIADTKAGKIIAAMIEDATGKNDRSSAARKELLERAFGKVKDEVEVKSHAVVWNETKTYKK